MTGYFTSDHFKLLDRWKGQRRDDSNPEQNRAYEELKKAYELTESWANAVQQKLYPHGRVELRKRPTNQANNFAGYNWAEIYPWPDAPQLLAFTVGIDATGGFVVKIDTVKLGDDDPLRQKYLVLRGPFSNASPFVRILPIADGLGKYTHARPRPAERPADVRIRPVTARHVERERGPRGRLGGDVVDDAAERHRAIGDLA